MKFKMDFDDEVTDIIDSESSILQDNNVEDNPSSSESNIRNTVCLKRKCEDEGPRPKKRRRIDDSDLLTQLNVTYYDLGHMTFLNNDCAPILEAEFEEANIDQKFLDYINTNVELLAGKNEIANQDKMAEIEEQASKSSARDTISIPLGDCSTEKFPSISHMGTLVHQESQNSDFAPDFGAIGDCDIPIITPEMKLQNDQQQIIEPSKGESVFKNEEQPNNEHFDAAYEMEYMNVNVEPVDGENEASNRNKVTENKEQISDSSRRETMLMSSGDFSSAKKPSNTDALAQQELQNNVLPVEKSAEATKLKNAPDEIMEANDEFSFRSTTKDQLTGTKKKSAILKERAPEEENGVILDLIKEYIEIAEVEEFTSSDIVDFVSKRMPNATYFKVLHAVRIFIVNNLKSAVLKKSGLKYRLGCRSSGASVANIP